jgi:uncharacterized cupin superfamily protein
MQYDDIRESMNRNNCHALSINEIEHRELVSMKTGKTFSKSAILTDFFEFKDLFVHHEILEPGKQASAPHRHTSCEEMIVVLEGCPTLYLGDLVRQLKPGDFVGFNPVSQELHFIENTTDEEVRFLVICSNPKSDQTIYN